MRIAFTVPFIPPSVNHYKMRTRRGVTFVSAEAKKFKQDLAAFASSAKSIFWYEFDGSLKNVRYELEVTVYFGKRQRGDGDNLWKCLADALVESGVIHSDAAVTDWIMRVRRDPSNPRTEIEIRRKGKIK